MHKQTIGPITIILIILLFTCSTIGILWYTGFIKFTDKVPVLESATLTEEGYHIGPFTITTNARSFYNQSSLTGSIPTVKFYRSDKDTFMGIGSSSGVTLNLIEEDKDTVYMVADIGSNTGYFVDPDATKLHGKPYVTDWFSWDYDSDHTPEYGFTLDLSKLPNLAAGQTAWVSTVDCYVKAADNALDITSITNVTSASYTTGGDYYTKMYLSSWAGEGYATKLAYVTFTTANYNSNATYFTNGTLSLKYISIQSDNSGSYSISGSNIGTFEEATNKTKIYPVDDYQREINDPMIYNWRGSGSIGNEIILHWYNTAWPGGNHRIRVTVNFYFINPAGTVSAAIAQVIEIRNSY